MSDRSELARFCPWCGRAATLKFDLDAWGTDDDWVRGGFTVAIRGHLVEVVHAAEPDCGGMARATRAALAARGRALGTR